MWAKIGGLIAEDLGFEHAYFAVCESDTITGPYELVEKVTELPAGDFDLVKFEDKAYVIFEKPHTEMICMELNETYTNVTAESSTHIPKPFPPFTREAPAFFAHNGEKYLLTSGTTGYFPNQSIMYKMASFHGEWTELGNACVGDIHGNSFHAQFSSVFKHPFIEGLYIALGDRWLNDLPPTMPSPDDLYESIFNPDKVDKIPCCVEKYTDSNTSLATYVWLPIRFNENDIPYIEWEDEWTTAMFEK